VVKVSGMAGWLALGVVAVGCASAFEELPNRERARFAQCERALELTCPSGATGCVAQLRSEYAERSREVDRQMYLVSNGCARTIAGLTPGHRGSSGGEAPVTSGRSLAALSPRAMESRPTPPSGTTADNDTQTAVTSTGEH
jgi:hypothetical protein